MSITLGEKLRQAREERGISISEVAEQTRISPMYLESIEIDNYKPLPGGIFNKGFVKAYAKYVGVDEQEALQDYARLVAEHEQIVEESNPRYRPEVLTDEAQSASSLVPTIVFAGIILALMTGGILFVVSYITNQPDTPNVAVNSTTPAANVSTNMQVGETNTAPAPTNQIRLEFAALSEKVSVTSTVDGNLAYDEVTPDVPKSYFAQEGVKLSYYRGFADKVKITLNGKEIAPPPAPAKGRNVVLEVTKDNLARILESGQIAAPVVEETPPPTPESTPRPAPTATATPAPTATSTPRQATPRPAFTPVATPRRTPTPIIVGRSPSPRPSPN